MRSRDMRGPSRTVSGGRKDLRRLREAEALRSLGIEGRRVQSLRGIERAQDLRRLFIEKMPSPELELILELPKLEELTLESLTGEIDFSPLERMTQLSYLRVGVDERKH